MPTEDDAQHEGATEDGTVDRATRSPVDDDDEDNDGVADILLDEDSHEVSFDLFESGNIWSQVQSTQLHREAWRRGINPRSDDDDRYGETANIFPRPVTSTDEALSNNIDAHPSSLDENAEPKQSAMPTATATAAQTDPWWRQGKTAPLLDQFDEQRRVWYLAQAGVYDHDKFVHDAQGISADVGDDDDDIIIVSPDATTSSRTPNARRLHPMLAAVTPLPRTAGLQRAALTLAGNVNSPFAPAARAALQTPKRKTWQSTLAQKEESRLAAAAAAAAATSSAKKRRQSGGGSGSTARTAASRTTTPRGRGTGRSFAPRSAPRTTTTAGRKST